MTIETFEPQKPLRLLQGRPLTIFRLGKGRRILERILLRLQFHDHGGTGPASSLIRRVIEKIDLDMLAIEKTRLRDKGFRFD